MYDFIIIGAGMSGVSFGRLLQMNGITNFKILEKENEIGGLCRTKNINGHILDVGGGHFWCTKHPEVQSFLFAHMSEDKFNLFDRVSKIDIHNCFVDYPLEYNLWQLPSDLFKKYIDSFLSNNKNDCHNNYREYIEGTMGKMISEQYMVPYNQKIWGVDPSSMDVDWIYKIPPFDKEKILSQNALRKNNSDSVMPSHAKFYYPKSGGFQTIFDAISEPLIQHIQTNYKIKSIKQKNGYVSVDEYEAKYIINTSPWIEIIEALSPESHIANAIKSLKASSIVVSLLENQYSHNYHWAYNPSNDIDHHRTFYINNFAPHSRENGIYVETNKNRHKKHGIYDFSNKYSYPIPTLGWRNTIKTILEYYKEKNIIGLGRWGQWEYFNSDVCILKSIKLFEELKNA